MNVCLCISVLDHFSEGIFPLSPSLKKGGDIGDVCNLVSFVEIVLRSRRDA